MTDKQQPEALRRADDLESEFAQGRISNHTGRKAATELRRLHAESEMRRAALLDEMRKAARLHAENETLRAGYAAARLEIESLKAQLHAADMTTAAAHGFRDGGGSLAASAGEPVAIRPDIQAVLAMLDVPVIARMSSHEGKLLKSGQEPPAFESAVPLVREWDHRRACESIIAALSRNNWV